ncbi:MAG: hypothetical protein ACK5RO_06675 [Pseudobdellovibrionaceae bacterium]|jgi:hypothetical protein
MITLADIKDRVKRELDMEDEDFVRPQEWIDWTNDGIDRAERLILGLYQDYFLTVTPITLVAGQAEYSLPAGIWAQKIRYIAFDDGSKKYDVRKIKQIKEVQEAYDTNERLRYIMINDGTTGIKLRFYPTPPFDGSFINIWYIRNAKEVTLDADVIDIPEAEQFIVQYVKDQAINKERLQPDAPPSAALKEEEQLLTESLAQRIVDEDDEIPLDLSFYERHL